MQGVHKLTPEMDVYAFSICCVEILTMGALPWPFMDDYAVRHLVLSLYPSLCFHGSHANTPPFLNVWPDENKRPSIPPFNLVSDLVMNFIRACWDQVPSNRPSFEQISRDVKRQRETRSTQNNVSRTLSQIPAKAASQSTQLLYKIVITIRHAATEKKYKFKVESTHLVGSVLTFACSAFCLDPTGCDFPPRIPVPHQLTDLFHAPGRD